MRCKFCHREIIKNECSNLTFKCVDSTCSLANLLWLHKHGNNKISCGLGKTNYSKMLWVATPDYRHDKLKRILRNERK